MPNVASIIERRLLPTHLRLLQAAANIAGRDGVELYLVGGTVRDLLLERGIRDLDLSVAGAPSEFTNTLAEELGGEVVARSRFGTAKIRVGDDALDLAMTRQEVYASPGALPEVSPGSIQQDLTRRDFTINAMAISLSADAWGELLDPFGGRCDVEGNFLRVIHPGSFKDDATRILRAVRYAQRLGFRIEAESERLLERDLHYLDTVTSDRVRHELERIFEEDSAASILRTAQELSILSAIHPALDLDGSILRALETLGPSPMPDRALMYVSLMAYSVPTENHPGFIARLNMGTDWARVVGDTGSVRESFERLSARSMRSSQIYDELRRYDIAAIRGCALATDDELVAQRLDLYANELRHVEATLGGGDVIALGVPQGPMVGILLREIVAARLDGLLADREDEERFVLGRLERGPDQAPSG